MCSTNLVEQYWYQVDFDLNHKNWRNSASGYLENRNKYLHSILNLFQKKKKASRTSPRRAIQNGPRTSYSRLAWTSCRRAGPPCWAWRWTSCTASRGAWVWRSPARRASCLSHREGGARLLAFIFYKPVWIKHAATGWIRSRAFCPPARGENPASVGRHYYLAHNASQMTAGARVVRLQPTSNWLQTHFFGLM